MEDAERLDRRAGRADDGAAATRGHRHAAHAAAGRRRRRPHARADRRVPGRERRGRARLRARIRLRTCSGHMGPRRRRPSRGRRQRGRADVPPRVESAARDRGEPRSGATRAPGGRARVLRSLLGGGPRRARGRRRGGGAHRHHDPLLAVVAQPRADTGPQVPRPDPTLRARDQRAHLHADGRDGGRAHDVASRDPGRRTELGLPLHVDPRHHVHPPGAALSEPRLGGGRVHAVRRRRRADRGRVAPDHVRHRWAPRPHGDDARRADRIRGRSPRADRQRCVRPASERRVRRRARLDPAPHAQERTPPAPALADRAGPGRVRDQGLAGAGPGNLGGSGQAPAVRVVEAHVLGRARPCSEARRDAGRPGADREVERGRRGDSQRDPREGRRRSRGPPTALRNRLARRLHAARRDLRVPPERRRAIEGERARDRRGAHRGRLRAPLSHRRDRRRVVREGRHLPDLLVLARLGARDRRRDATRARSHGAAPANRVAARSLRGRVRRRDRAPSRQLPAGVLAPGADGSGGANHRARDARAVPERSSQWTRTT